jgi:glutamine amidotransferase
MITIIDYGMGNVGSIRNMLKKIGVPSIISAEPEQIRAADKLILPGVGSFDHGMSNLATRGLIPLLNEKVIGDRIPILGICLGMQLLSQSSDEGKLPGLGWIEAKTRCFKFDGDYSHLKIPHMGWSQVKGVGEGLLFQRFPEPPRFYFVHSYHVCCSQPEDVMGIGHYGVDFTAAIRRDNILGTQFHPEKSHKFGMQVLRNFIELV